MSVGGRGWVDFTAVGVTNFFFFAHGSQISSRTLNSRSERTQRVRDEARRRRKVTAVASDKLWRFALEGEAKESQRRYIQTVDRPPTSVVVVVVVLIIFVSTTQCARATHTHYYFVFRVELGGAC